MPATIMPHMAMMNHEYKNPPFNDPNAGVAFQSALKTVLGLRGLPVRPDVRAPLRALDPEERDELEQWLGSS